MEIYNYSIKLKKANEDLDYYKSMSLENNEFERIVDIAEYMIERIEFHKIQFDKYENEETKNHINLLFIDIQSLFNNSLIK